MLRSIAASNACAREKPEARVELTGAAVADAAAFSTISMDLGTLFSLVGSWRPRVGLSTVCMGDEPSPVATVCRRGDTGPMETCGSAAVPDPCPKVAFPRAPCREEEENGSADGTDQRPSIACPGALCRDEPADDMTPGAMPGLLLPLPGGALNREATADDMPLGKGPVGVPPPMATVGLGSAPGELLPPPAARLGAAVAPWSRSVAKKDVLSCGD